MQQTDSPALITTSYLGGLLGVPVTGMEPVYGGRNNRVYGVGTADGTRYAAKVYSGATADGRSRISAEFSSLTFLQEQGVTCVPKPIIADEPRACAVYEFIDGRKVAPAEITGSDIDQVTRFLLLLDDVKSASAAGMLPRAAEACFSLQALFSNIEARISRLRAVETESPQSKSLETFLHDDLVPAFQEISSWSSGQFEAAGRTQDSELEIAERTLSPSDFGFHNCLKQDDGRLVFLDFEYFGWDDPAKMVSDFLLHPAMELSPSLKNRFLDGILRGMDPEQRLRARVGALYPLYGLKWCSILLNEFLPESLARRRFSSGQEINKIEIQEQQLEKSRRMLQMFRSSYERFPSW